MAVSAQQQLNALQRSLYEKAVDEAKQLASIGAPTILNYSEKYLRSLPKNFDVCEKNDVIDAMANHQIVLYGDFHTLRQSQRGLVRLLRSFEEKFPNRRIVLALEMFKARDQKYIDAFLEGRLKEERFLEKTSYEKEWSFPWHNYRMLMDYAQDHNIDVIGINTDNAGKDPLSVRDRFAAETMHRIVREDASALVVCLIGEYHLADPYLPHCLKETFLSSNDEPRLMRIFTNVDQYYFQNDSIQGFEGSEYLQLKPADYCILNTPPWIKWQSYVIWEETRGIGQHNLDDWEDRDIALYVEDSFDIDSQALEILRTLGGFLGLNLESSALTGFSVQLNPGESVLKHYIRKYRVPLKDLHAHSHRISVDGLSYLVPAGIMFLRDLSLNGFAEVCGQYLACVGWREHRTSHVTEAFCRRVLQFAGGVVAAKILNPRRKGSDLWDYRKLLQQTKGKRLIGSAQLKREATRWLFRFLEKVEKNGSERLSTKWLQTIAHWDDQSFYEISRVIGEVIGQEIYRAVLRQKIPADALRDLFTTISSESAADKVQRLARHISPT